MRQVLVSLLLSSALLSQATGARNLFCFPRGENNIPRQVLESFQAIHFRSEVPGATLNIVFDDLSTKLELCAHGIVEGTRIYTNYNCGSFNIAMDFKKREAILKSTYNSNTSFEQVLECNDTEPF